MNKDKLDLAKKALVAVMNLTLESIERLYPEQFAEFLRQEGYSTIDDWSAAQLEKGPVYNALLEQTSTDISFANTLKVVIPIALNLITGLFPGLG